MEEINDTTKTEHYQLYDEKECEKIKCIRFRRFPRYGTVACFGRPEECEYNKSKGYPKKLE